MIKFTILLRRNPALTREEMIKYHKEHHATLFSSLPEVQKYVRRYVQSHSTDDSIPGIPPMTFDGATELWFDDLSALESLFGAPSYMDTIRPDEMKFLDLEHCEFLLATENIVLS